MMAYHIYIYRERERERERDIIHVFFIHTYYAFLLGGGGSLLTGRLLTAGRDQDDLTPPYMALTTTPLFEQINCLTFRQCFGEVFGGFGEHCWGFGGRS